MSAETNDANEKAALWLNMALATGVAAFVFATSTVLVLLAVFMNLWAWRVADGTKRGTGKIVAGSGLTAVAVFGYFTGTTFV